MADADETRQRMEQLSNEELISIFLKKRDENQSQPEAVEIAGAILSERGIAAGKDLKCTVGAEKVSDETAGLNLITVAEYVSHLDAEFDRLILEGEGMKAWIFNNDEPQPPGFPSSVQLKVIAEDWKAAIEKLASEDEQF